MSIVKLPVSLGEAVDKLTILDIKLERITDHRRKDVETEYLLLKEELKEVVQKHHLLYRSMKKVNILIWDMMDILRDGDVSDKVYMKVCRECIEYNDIRFRVKNKINMVSNSELKEQKSYKTNRLLVEMGASVSVEECKNHLICVSLFYDEVIVVSNSNMDTSMLDPTIQVRNDVPSLEFKKKLVLSDVSKLDETFQLTEEQIQRLL